MKQSVLDNNLVTTGAYNEKININALNSILGKKIVPIDNIYANTQLKANCKPAVIDSQYLCYDKYLPIYCLNDSGNPLEEPSRIIIYDYKHSSPYGGASLFNFDYTYDRTKGILYIKLKDFDENQGYPEPANIDAPVEPACAIYLRWSYEEE